MWLPEQRYEQILSLIKQEGMVKASELRRRIGVSSETVRRDLEYLESEGHLRRTHGGALASEHAQSQTGGSFQSFQQREKQNIAQKVEVADLALRYIQEGQSLALDSGTTSCKLAELLKTRFNHLTVVTNSLQVANELVDVRGFTVILTGGVIQSDEYSLTSDMATLIFSGLRINTFFLTTCGVSVDQGITYQRPDEIGVQLKMLETSDRTILITDSSKLGVNSLFRMCDLEKIHMIITDSGVTPGQIEAFQKVHIRVVHPGSPLGDPKEIR